MTNGCSKCEKLEFGQLCIDCQIEQADVDVCRAMDELDRLRKRKIELKKKKEQEHAKL